MKLNKLVVAMTVGMLSVSIPAFADGSAFTPLNFDETSYSTSSTTSTNTKSVANNTPVTTSTTNTTAVSAQADSVANGNIQNAILQLDNAQTDIKNDLLNYKTKFQEVDNHYKLIRTERNNLKKQIKAIERRSKNIDKAKEKLRKNMV